MRWTRMSLAAAVAVLAIALCAGSAFGRSAPPVPVIEQPADEPHHQRDATVTLSGTAMIGAVVALYEGETRLNEQPVVDGTWRFEVAGVAVGEHVYGVRAEDVTGPSEFATRTVIIDPPPAPAITAPGDRAVLVRRAADVGGTAEAGAEVIMRDGETELGRATADAGGAWAMSVQLDRGEHVLTAEAVDAAGNHSERSAPVTVQVASATITSARGTHFEFAATPSVPLTCRVVGATSDASCATSYDAPRLPPGSYRFLVFPAGGDEALGDSRDFTIVAPPQPPPTPPAEPEPPAPLPAPVPLPIEIPAPVPLLRQTVVLRPLDGDVLVRRPGAISSVALGATEAVPLGATIDARRGRVRLTAARTGNRPPQRAEFSGGVFVVTQKGARVDLRMTGPGGRCAKRRLTGEGRGNFRISGRYATATARGTTWLVQDTCRGTLIRVKQGVVAARDKVRHRTVLVHPRKPYLAKPRRR